MLITKTSSAGDRSLVNAAGIERVDSEAGKALVGRRDQGSYSGLAIPYSLPGDPHVRERRLRRDHPEIEYKDGKPRERNKYLSPPGGKNMLYFPPAVAPELLQKIDIPVIITEGEFKTLSLWRASNFEVISPRFLSIGCRVSGTFAVPSAKPPALMATGVTKRELSRTSTAWHGTVAEWS
jgi:hypothetical protein